MAPEQRAALAELARLRRELGEDDRAMYAHLETLRELHVAWATAVADVRHRKATLALAAVSLHAWYTALETALERILRTLDGGIPSGDSSHRTVVSLAMTEVPGLRPAVLPAALTSELLALLSFRHFFRHAYAVDLDPDKLRREIDRINQIADGVRDALRVFDAFLARSEAAAAR